MILDDVYNLIGHLLTSEDLFVLCERVVGQRVRIQSVEIVGELIGHGVRKDCSN